MNDRTTGPVPTLDLWLEYKRAANPVTRAVLRDCIRARFEGHPEALFYLEMVSLE